MIQVFSKTMSDICNSINYVKKIVILATNANPQKYTCSKGDKPMDRLFYITKGKFNITEKGCENIVATEGDLLFLPADVEYTSFWDESYDASYIAFNYDLFDEKGNKLHLSNHITVALNDKDLSVYQILKECANTYIQNEKYASLALQSQFYKLIYIIFRNQDRKIIKADKKYSEIYKAILYLDDHYMSEISTEELAKMCNLNATTFRRIFKKYKSVSPMKYKQTLRMKHAKSMLESGVYNVSEVANIMKCSDLSHFNKLYFSAFGINPSESKKHID